MVGGAVAGAVLHPPGRGCQQRAGGTGAAAAHPLLAPGATPTRPLTGAQISAVILHSTHSSNQASVNATA